MRPVEIIDNATPEWLTNYLADFKFSYFIQIYFSNILFSLLTFLFRIENLISSDKLLTRFGEKFWLHLCFFGKIFEFTIQSM